MRSNMWNVLGAFVLGAGASHALSLSAWRAVGHGFAPRGKRCFVEAFGLGIFVRGLLQRLMGAVGAAAVWLVLGCAVWGYAPQPLWLLAVGGVLSGAFRAVGERAALGLTLSSWGRSRPVQETALLAARDGVQWVVWGVLLSSYYFLFPFSLSSLHVVSGGLPSLGAWLTAVALTNSLDVWLARSRARAQARLLDVHALAEEAQGESNENDTGVMLLLTTGLAPRLVLALTHQLILIQWTHLGDAYL